MNYTNWITKNEFDKKMKDAKCLATIKFNGDYDDYRKFCTLSLHDALNVCWESFVPSWRNTIADVYNELYAFVMANALTIDAVELMMVIYKFIQEYNPTFELTLALKEN